MKNSYNSVKKQINNLTEKWTEDMTDIFQNNIHQWTTGT